MKKKKHKKIKKEDVENDFLETIGALVILSVFIYRCLFRYHFTEIFNDVRFSC